MGRFHSMLGRASLVTGLLLCFLMTGCVGPTQTLQQGTDLCDAGIQYTDALDKLLDVTIETVIDYDSDELIRQRKYADPNDLRGFLDERNKALTEQVRTLETFRSHSRRLRAYFTSLGELTGATLQDSAAAAVENLSGSIAAANESLRKSERVDLNDEEQVYLSKLGGLMAKGAHAGAVRAALRRDAAVIAEQLVLHERLMAKLRGILEDRYAGQRDTIGRQKVRGPYVSTDQSIGDGWKNDRREWIRSGFYLDELTKATEAIQQMRYVWAGILEGRQDAHSVQLALNDIHDFTQATTALHEAGKEKED